MSQKKDPHLMVGDDPERRIDSGGSLKTAGTRFPLPNVWQNNRNFKRSVDFEKARNLGLSNIHGLLAEWLPGGKMEGPEYVVLNPLRDDRHRGSFKINTRSGKWADFATDARGGDIVSLLAYLRGTSQVDAAREILRARGGR